MLQRWRGRANLEGFGVPGAKPISSIAFHRAFWRREDEDCHLRYDGTASARFAEFLRDYLALEPSASVSLVGSGRVALRLGLAALARLEPRRKKVIVPTIAARLSSPRSSTTGLCQCSSTRARNSFPKRVIISV